MMFFLLRVYSMSLILLVIHAVVGLNVRIMRELNYIWSLPHSNLFGNTAFQYGGLTVVAVLQPS